MVSTDSDEIGGFVSRFGAIYHKRSPETCADDSPMIDAILEVLETGDNWEHNFTCMIYPVAPFIQASDIQDGLHKLQYGHEQIVLPVYEAREMPERGMILHGDKMVPRYPEWKDTNSQAFHKTYHSAGQWYVARTAFLQTHRTWTPLECAYIEIPQERAIDIDTPTDWQLAELIYMLQRYPGMAETVQATYHEQMSNGQP